MSHSRQIRTWELHENPSIASYARYGTSVLPLQIAIEMYHPLGFWHVRMISDTSYTPLPIARALVSQEETQLILIFFVSHVARLALCILEKGLNYREKNGRH